MPCSRQFFARHPRATNSATRQANSPAQDPMRSEQQGFDERPEPREQNRRNVTLGCDRRRIGQPQIRARATANSLQPKLPGAIHAERELWLGHPARCQSRPTPARRRSRAEADAPRRSRDQTEDGERSWPSRAASPRGQVTGVGSTLDSKASSRPQSLSRSSVRPSQPGTTSSSPSEAPSART
jgi:hypothetical protein